MGWISCRHARLGFGCLINLHSPLYVLQACDTFDVPSTIDQVLPVRVAGPWLIDFCHLQAGWRGLRQGLMYYSYQSFPIKRRAPLTPGGRVVVRTLESRTAPS